MTVIAKNTSFNDQLNGMATDNTIHSGSVGTLANTSMTR
jgi:hypothetical protein